MKGTFVSSSGDSSLVMTCPDTGKTITATR